MTQITPITPNYEYYSPPEDGCLSGGTVTTRHDVYYEKDLTEAEEKNLGIDLNKGWIKIPNRFGPVV